MRELIDGTAKYLIALVVIGGCFLLIYNGRGGDMTQPWSVITLVVGWLIRDNAGTSATNSVLRVQAAQPTVTATSGPPATVTSTPGGSDA